jgi:GTP cyclohydrolase I
MKIADAPPRDTPLPQPEPGEVIIGPTPNVEYAANLVRDLLREMGHDTAREGLADTPARVARFYREFITRRPLRTLTTFDAEGTDEMVVVRKVPFYSLCEHHLLPFFGTATVGYIPDKRIVGLSKLPRIVHHFARGLQNQNASRNRWLTA